MAKKKKESIIEQIIDKQLLQNEINLDQQNEIQEIKTFEHSLHGKFIHIKYGTEKQQPSDKQLLELEQRFNAFLEENNINNSIAFVTRHDVEIKVY